MERTVLLALLSSLAVHVLVGARLPMWKPTPAVTRVLEFDSTMRVAPPVEPEVVKRVEAPARAVVAKTRAPVHRAPAIAPSLPASPVGELAVPAGPPAPPGVPFVELGGGGVLPPVPGGAARVATLPDAEPRLREEVRLEYPAEARDAEVDGEVELLVTIDVNGRVVAVKVLRGQGYGLDEAAVQAIRQSRWEPGVRSGAPATLTVRYVYRFVLQ